MVPRLLSAVPRCEGAGPAGAPEVSADGGAMVSVACGACSNDGVPAVPWADFSVNGLAHLGHRTVRPTCASLTFKITPQCGQFDLRCVIMVRATGYSEGSTGREFEKCSAHVLGRGESIGWFQGQR